jgi:hypothetical protein
MQYVEENFMSESQLEKEFEKLIDTVGEQIAAHVATAVQSLKAATDLADQYGIPFFTNVSELGQPYIPDSFRNKWGTLDKEFVANLTEVGSYELNSSYGWQHSQVC